MSARIGPVLVLLAACGGGESQPQNQGGSQAAPPPSAASGGGAGEAKVSIETRHFVSGKQPCGSGDVCGFFLQVASPGSDAKDLADKAVRLIKGKCAGHVIVYKDKRGIMGAGPVFATADEKRACEKALGRPEDPDFPNALVWKVGT